MSSQIKSSPISISYFLILFLLYILRAQASGTTTQSIISYDGFFNQRPCARACFSGDGGCADSIGCVLGCVVYNDVFSEDQCYCRPDLQPFAYRYISSCISASCKPAGDITLDLQTATDIYSGYCSGALSPSIAPPPASATTTTPDISSKSAAAPSSSATEGASPTIETTSVTQTSKSLVISTAPPSTTTATATRTSLSLTEGTVTVTRVFGPPSASEVCKGFNIQLKMVMLAVFICIASL